VLEGLLERRSARTVDQRSPGLFASARRMISSTPGVTGPKLDGRGGRLASTAPRTSAAVPQNGTRSVHSSNRSTPSA
jgi:hypothetical protein